jgi:hypothetical protein
MWLDGMPDEVLDLLTSPEAIALWTPVPFELIELRDDRLRAGSRARVRGGLGPHQLEFEVDIQEADDGRLALVATGPVRINAEYELRATAGGSQLRASVSVTGRGILGRVLASTVDGLLAAGALRVSVARLGQQLRQPVATA